MNVPFASASFYLLRLSLGYAALTVVCLSVGVAQEAEPTLEAISKRKLTKPILFKNPPAAKKSEDPDPVADVSDAESEETEPKPASVPTPTKRDIDPDGDLAKMKAQRIEIPAFEAIPSRKLPKLLRSDAATATEPETKSGPLRFLKSSESDAVSESETETSEVTPVSAQPDPESAFVAEPNSAVSGDVERLRSADTQADSFRAALAVAMDGEGNLPVSAAPAPAPTVTPQPLGAQPSIGDPVESTIRESDDVALPMKGETRKKRGWFSGLTDRLKSSSTDIGSQSVEAVTEREEETGQIGNSAVDEMAAPERTGFASWFKKKPETEESVEAPEGADISVAAAVEVEVEEPDMPASKSGLFSRLFKFREGEEAVVESVEAPNKPKKKLFGGLFSANRKSEVDVESIEAPIVEPEAEVEVPASKKFGFGKLFKKDAPEEVDEALDEDSAKKFRLFKWMRSEDE